MFVTCLHDDLVISDVLMDVTGVELCKAREVPDDDLEHNLGNEDVCDEACKIVRITFHCTIVLKSR